MFNIYDIITKTQFLCFILKGENMTQKVRSNVYLYTELKELAKKMFKNYGLNWSNVINFL